MSETAVLLGVRDVIRGLGYKPNECDIEIDSIPATAGEIYVAVSPGGLTAGPNNLIGGGVLDELYAVQVDVIIRAPKHQPDKRRNVLLDVLNGLNARLNAIRAAIHFNDTVMQRINDNITDSTEKFIEPLKFVGFDPRPTIVPAEFFFGKSGDDRAGMKRGCRFVNARRIQYQTKQS